MVFPTIPVLAYHQIVPVSSLKRTSPFAVSTAEFERQMDYLYQHGYRCLSLMELLKNSAGKAGDWKKCFALTFDDGYEDFYTGAFPALQRCRFTATVFLVTDLVGTQSNWAGERGNPLLTWTQIKTLQSEGVNFGSHTCTHPVLPHLFPEQIEAELVNSKRCLEAKLEQKVAWLAYPYGESNTQVQGIVRKAGYQAAWGVDSGKSGPFNLWRCEIHQNDSLQTFVHKLSRWNHYWRQLKGWLRYETKIGPLLRHLKRARFAHHELR